MTSFHRLDRREHRELLQTSCALLVSSRELLALPVYPWLPVRHGNMPAPDPMRAALSDFAQYAGQEDMRLAFEFLSTMEALLSSRPGSKETMRPDG
ncbi:hypothetical protein [Roseomonas indoligenes]|uniref:Uncharacterized protein n=1 Tax=Roseomonas indoligenes TaxID=2820811 RepID=A0A940N9K7_9PROT|nr:hypothetical protein [Pararoseomonas indoligenes]MBP0496537.1 hypothetical protein [Pararoseomonas indoligenes]